MDGFHPAGLGPLGPLMFMSAPLSPRNLRHSSERVAIVERILGVNPQLIQSSHRFRLAQQGFELLQGDDDRRLSWCHWNVSWLFWTPLAMYHENVCIIDICYKSQLSEL